MSLYYALDLVTFDTIFKDEDFRAEDSLNAF